MRRGAVVAIAGCVAVLMLAAPAGAKAKPQPTSAELAAHLLALNDMPAGWALDQTPPTGPSQTQGFCNGPNTIAIVQSIPGYQNAGVTYTEGSLTGADISHAAYSFPTVKGAKLLMTRMKKIAQDCTAWDGTSPSGTAYHYTLTPESAGKAGDDSLALRYTAALPDQPGTSSGVGDGIYVRSGRVVQLVTQAGLTIDPKLTARYTATGLKKLDPLLGS